MKVLEATRERTHILITSVPHYLPFSEMLIQASRPSKAYRHKLILTAFPKRPCLKVQRGNQDCDLQDQGVN